MKIRSKPNNNNSNNNPINRKTQLTGRESLIRLIGKRRRFLPNRQSIISSPLQICLTVVKDENREEELVVERNDSLVGTSGSDKVICPVCGNEIRGGEYMINSHLDACLTRGTKRKLSQQTLLQFNFSPRSKIKVYSIDSDDTKSKPASHDKDTLALSVVSTEETIEYESSSSSDNVALALKDNSAETTTNDDTIITEGSTVNDLEVCENDSANSDDDILGKLLATFIVGRRYGEEVELRAGDTISLSRDPENTKDPNAVKVLSAESSKALGYIPRELAQHLSKLMDTFGLNFEGRVMSVPEQSRAVVPVQIWCQENIPCSELEGEKLQVFKSLCRHVLTAV